MSSRSNTARSVRTSKVTRPRLEIVGRKGRRGLIKRTGSRRFALAWAAAAVVVVAIVFSVLLEQVVLAQSAFHLSKLTGKVNSAEDSHQALLVQWARLQSQNRIEHYARTHLGMINPPPGDIQYIVANVTDDGGGRLVSGSHRRLVGANLAAPQESP
jgi:cell division protein FtsB